MKLHDDILVLVTPLMTPYMHIEGLRIQKFFIIAHGRIIFFKVPSEGRLSSTLYWRRLR